MEITHGGIVAVDPDGLRAMAGRVRADAAAVQVAREELLEIPVLVEASGLAARLPLGGLGAVWAATGRLDAIDSALDEVASATATMADVFEIADLRAWRQMPGPADPGLVKGSLHRIDELLARNPGLVQMQRELQEGWARDVFEGFTAAPGASLSEAQGTAGDLLAALSPAVRVALLTGGATEAGISQGALLLLMLLAPGLGQTPRAPLEPTPGVVFVDGVPGPGAPGRGAVGSRPGDLLLTSRPGRLAGGSTAAGALPVPAAPASLSDAISRIPFGEGPQVRVERYVLADGSARVVAYVDGTRPGRPDTEPWDMRSNVQAYLRREESDSYKATVAALRAAGVDEKTPVDLVGYSQGGMNVDLIAQSGAFTVQGVYTIGSPVEPALPGDVMHVAVRHTDDPVAGLAGGGRPDGSGSAQSVVITRAAVPGHGIDAGMPAHRFGEYRETVQRAEQSGDPRMTAIRDRFAAYDGASLIDATDFTATRVTESG